MRNAMMRYASTMAIVMMVVLVAAVLSPPARAADVSFDVFYSNLSPHGSWLVSAQYGRCWQPRVYAANWNPYYDGHWVYTDIGWTWVSDYEWGAIPYHYGTWVDDPEYGWVWIPGYVWAPAWVVFRTGPDYIGWAPVEPGYSVGASFSFGARTSGPFVFVSASNFLAPRVRSCIVPETRTRLIINNTKVVNNLVIQNNIVVNRGPDRTIVERASGRRIREVPIERVARVAPGGRVDRSRLAVDPQRMKHGPRAAEPVSDKTPLPIRGRRAEGPAARDTGGVVRGEQTARPARGGAESSRAESNQGRTTPPSGRTAVKPRPRDENPAVRGDASRPSRATTDRTNVRRKPPRQATPPPEAPKQQEQVKRERPVRNRGQRHHGAPRANNNDENS